MPGKMNLELKVGIFAFIALIILTMAVFSISEIYIFRPGYLINVSFGFASGIDVGATVRVAGIGAGEVEDINLSYDKDKGQAEIILSVWIDKDVKIPRDSQAHVNILGLIGERYLEIIPGEDYTHPLKEGDTLIGRNPLSSETLMEAAHKLAENFDQVLDSANEVLDENTRQALKETIHNFRDLSLSLKVITGRLERGEGKLGAWLKPKRSSKRKPKTKSTEVKEVESTQSTQNFGPR
ncbi:MAG: MlaD family protein [Omnitrophica bacterium]|nr:MlaD family protein [Candidatus Omnitrophota bacterium]